ncbi:MAG TPA: flavodoxin family protein, partial [Sediminispirochaeta sp.]|nr:flavodoxin family protein [Sediminispirochaeta sp.]
IEDEMNKLGPVEFEHIFLREQNLELCKGCFNCVIRGREFRPLKDDLPTIESKIDQADGLILVSPCYVSNVSWLMKNFMDRMCYTNHRHRFFHQKMLLVSNAGAGMEKTIEALRLAVGAGPEIVGELSYLSPPWQLAEKVQRKQQKRLAKNAEHLYRAIERDAPRGGLPKRPSFSDYVRFRFFQKISEDVRNYLKADYQFYKDMKSYYYPTKINPCQRIAASLMLKTSMFFMRDMAPSEP